MAFTRPLLLLLMALVAYFAWLGRPTGRYGRRRNWTALVLRCLIALLVVLGLAGLQSVRGGDELAVVFLVDVSDSISDAEQERALAFVREALAAMGPTDQAAVVLFGADALVERPMSSNQQLGAVASVPQTHQTDLEEALQLGVALFPGGAARRMVLLTDGRATVGDVETTAQLAQAQGIVLDVVSLDHPVAAEAWLTGLDLPTRLYQGESFTLLAVVESTVQEEAVLTVLSGDRVVAQEIVRLSPGLNRFAVPLVSGEPGFVSYRALLSPAADTYLQNNSLSAFTLVEGPPRILLAASEPQEARYLLQALRAAGLPVDESSPGALPSDPASLAEYAAVVLVDIPAQSLSPRAMTALQSFVRDAGGGLVAVGGPHAYGVGGWYDTPLEETLPVEMTVHDPERFPPMSIVVVIDKSGSMMVEENGVAKIRLAGEAAARVAELINDMDEITVIAFDDRPADVIGPLPGSQREAVIEQVIRLQAGGGGIYVRESLEAALGFLGDSDNPVRHIILLADGADSEHQEGVTALIERQMVEQNITLSTVAIGEGQDLQFLQQIAQLGGGRYYFTDQASNLPLIFAQETQLAMRSYIVEEPFFPRQAASSPILQGIPAAPQLLGYVATTIKPAAQAILLTHQEDPLLAVWQYGLGRSIAWASDATGRWARQWVSWDDFSQFWAQVVRWTVAQQSDIPIEMDVALEEETAHVTVNALDDDGRFINSMAATIRLLAPGMAAETIELHQTAPGQYEGTFTPQEEGAYLLQLRGTAGAESVALTGGWVLGYSPEYAALGVEPAYLAHLAELGGGRVLQEPAAAFEHNLRGSGTARDLWPYLLGAALLLFPFDVGVRRLALTRRDWARAEAWLRERLPSPRPRPAVETPSPVSRLFEAKERAESSRRPAPAPPETISPPPASISPPPPPAAAPSPPPPPPEGSLAARLLQRKKERGQGDEP
ncbi:MAG: VWA domain-containing protein [Anaerolineae bacterium]|nr:VWA domain-containing protein [Anaerolineae bacterium]